MPRNYNAFIKSLPSYLSLQVATHRSFDIGRLLLSTNLSYGVLPDERMLVTEKKGQLMLVDQAGERTPFHGLPDVGYGGQGGLGDVVLHPNFEENSVIYLSFVESAPDGTRGTAVGRGTVNLEGRRPYLSDFEVIWRQYPKMIGYGHYGHRMMFDDEGYLWITSGDRQKFTPAQDMQSNLGKVIRLNDDGQPQ